MNLTGKKNYIELTRFIEPDKANECAQVLDAFKIPYNFIVKRTETIFYTPEEYFETAQREINNYFTEQRPSSQPVFADSLFPVNDSIQGSMLYILLIGLIYIFSVRSSFSDRLFHLGSGNAELIYSGEWWRAITALTLHSGFLHLLRNAAAGAFFGTLASRYIGQGTAWTAIWISGISGNLLSAFIYESNHIAVGASTAVFGALGIFITYLCLRYKKMKFNKAKMAFTFLVGLGLLGFFGTSGENTDVIAHICGFITGSIIGIILGIVKDYIEIGVKSQMLLLLIMPLLIGLGWFFAV